MSSSSRHRWNIEVTERDIERAIQNNSMKCMVAQAIAREIPDATFIDVDTQTVRFTRDNERLVYLTPYSVRDYVIAFDAGDPIEPFRFQLRERGLLRAARKRTTPAGKAADRARSRAARDNRRAGASDAEIKEAAAAAYDAARQANPGTGKTTVRSSNPDAESPARPAPRRVFKTGKRAYGHRLLRINQQRPAPPAQP
jgi:hypothetical protein